MSYCRFGWDGSDVYVFLGGMQSYTCWADTDSNPRTATEVVERLFVAERNDSCVPQYAIDKLLHEAPGELAYAHVDKRRPGHGGIAVLLELDDHMTALGEEFDVSGKEQSRVREVARAVERTLGKFGKLRKNADEETLEECRAREIVVAALAGVAARYLKEGGRFLSRIPCRFFFRGYAGGRPKYQPVKLFVGPASRPTTLIGDVELDDEDLEEAHGVARNIEAVLERDPPQPRTIVLAALAAVGARYVDDSLRTQAGDSEDRKPFRAELVERREDGDRPHRMERAYCRIGYASDVHLYYAAPEYGGYNCHVARRRAVLSSEQREALENDVAPENMPDPADTQWEDLPELAKKHDFAAFTALEVVQSLLALRRLGFRVPQPVLEQLLAEAPGELAVAHVTGVRPGCQGMAVTVWREDGPAALSEEFAVLDEERGAAEAVAAEIEGALRGVGERDHRVLLAALALVTSRYLETGHRWESTIPAELAWVHAQGPSPARRRMAIAVGRDEHRPALGKPFTVSDAELREADAVVRAIEGALPIRSHPIRRIVLAALAKVSSGYLGEGDGDR